MNSFSSESKLHSRKSDLERMEEALREVARVISIIDLQQIEIGWSESGDPTTSVDRHISQALRSVLPRCNEGWLCEEEPDNLERLQEHRTWIVDPLDGTREFLLGLPEWDVSVGLIENGHAVAGGILSPMTGELFLGSIETGMTVSLAGKMKQTAPLAASPTSVLISRREHREGKWKHLHDAQLTMTPMGSIAYRLAQVAAHRAAATCTHGPRHEWDVAAGVALVHASGGTVVTMSGEKLQFNRRTPRVESLLAYSPFCDHTVPALLLGGSA